MDAVCANLLQSYRSTVTVVSAAGAVEDIGLVHTNTNTNSKIDSDSNSTNDTTTTTTTAAAVAAAAAIVVAGVVAGVVAIGDDEVELDGEEESEVSVLGVTLQRVSFSSNTTHNNNNNSNSSNNNNTNNNTISDSFTAVNDECLADVGLEKLLIQTLTHKHSEYIHTHNNNNNNNNSNSSNNSTTAAAAAVATEEENV